MRIGKFGDAGSVARAAEGRGEECVETGFRLFDPYHPGTHSDDVRVIVIAREIGRKLFGNDRATHLRVAIGCHRDTETSSAQSDTTLGFARRNMFGQLVSVIGIIDRCRVMRAEVYNLMPGLTQMRDKRRLQIERGMIRCYRNTHGAAQLLIEFQRATFSREDRRLPQGNVVLRARGLRARLSLMNDLSPREWIAEEKFVGFSVEEYIDLTEHSPLNSWEGKLELVDGEIIRMSPPAWPHSEVARRIFLALNRVLGDGVDGWIAGYEISFILSRVPRTVRQPDVCIFRVPQDVDRVLTSESLLIAIEVADTTLKDDLGAKHDDYAAAGIADYWVADVNKRETHVFSGPVDGAYRGRDLLPFGSQLALPQGMGRVTI